MWNWWNGSSFRTEQLRAHVPGVFQLLAHPFSWMGVTTVEAGWQTKKSSIALGCLETIFRLLCVFLEEFMAGINSSNNYGQKMTMAGLLTSWWLKGEGKGWRLNLNFFVIGKKLSFHFSSSLVETSSVGFLEPDCYHQDIRSQWIFLGKKRIMKKEISHSFSEYEWML